MGKTKGGNKGKSKKDVDENPNHAQNNKNSKQGKKGGKNQPKGGKNSQEKNNFPCPHFEKIKEQRVRTTFSDKIFEKAISGIQLSKNEKNKIKGFHPLVNWYHPDNLFICLNCGQAVDEAHFEDHFNGEHCQALSLEDRIIICKQCDKSFDIEPGTLCGELLNINEKKVTPLTVAASSTVKSEVRLKGLINMGNSCWMNSVLQMLAHLPNFAVGGGRLCGAFRNLQSSLLITEQVSGRSRSTFAIRPNEFVDVLRSKLDFLDVREQQDANEFLIFLLDLIRNEQDGNSTSLTSGRLENVQGCLNTPLDRLFGFIMKREMICSNCQNIKCIYERAATLSLFLPFAGSGTTLDDCLQMFFSESSPDEEHECDFCNTRSELIIKPSLVQENLPEVLILHLSRFRVGRNGYIKNNIDVVFTEELDLSQILGIDAVYSLFGFVTHYGSIDSGHYTSLGKVGDKFYLFDDDTVTPVNKETGFQLQPYIMFYIRKHET